MDKAGRVHLVLALFSFYATVAATSVLIRDCEWTHHVTGQVNIKDERTLEHLGTLDKDQRCPINVSFYNCTACVKDQSNITISCQIIGEDYPTLMLEIGNGKHGTTEIPEFIGCKSREEVIEKAKQDLQTKSPPKIQSEWRRLGILASLIFVIGLLCFFIIYWFCKKRRDKRSSKENILLGNPTNKHANGLCDSAGQPNGLRDSAGQPNGLCDSAGQPNGLRDSAAQPNALRDSAAQPNALRDSAGQPNALLDSAGQPNALRDSAGQPNALRDSAGQPNGLRDSAGQPNGLRDSAGQPNGLCDSAGQPNGLCDSAGQSNGLCDSAGQPNGSCHTVVQSHDYVIQMGT